MSNVLRYKNYAARVEFDAEDGVFFGRVAGIEDGVTFHADTVKGLNAAFREAVDDYLETCTRIGKNPDRPYSGQVYLRVDPAVHARVAIAAKLSGKSINQLGEEALLAAIGKILPEQAGAA